MTFGATTTSIPTSKRGMIAQSSNVSVADLAPLRVPCRRISHLHQFLPHLVYFIGLALVHEGLASVEGRDLCFDRRFCRKVAFSRVWESVTH